MMEWFQLDTLLYRLLALLFAIVVHELAHGLTARALGNLPRAKAGRLSINPAKYIDPIGLSVVLLGPYGWGRRIPLDSSQFSRPKLHGVLVLGAGPLVNLLFGIIFIFLATFEPVFMLLDRFPLAFGELISQFIYWSGVVHLMMFILNFLPLYPMDGWQLLRTLWGKHQERIERFEAWTMIPLILLLLLPYDQQWFYYLYQMIVGWF